MSKGQKAILHGTLTLLVLAVIALFLAPGIVEDDLNQVDRSTEWSITSKAQALHNELRVADLHADTLLWQRDLTQRSERGHVDLPRLLEGGVTLQVMAAVTKSPSGQNYESNSTSASDRITSLVIVQRWPIRTWDSLLERALYQAQRLHEAAADPRLEIVLNRADLESFLEQQADAESDNRTVATLLATEGAHPLEGDADNLSALWHAGYRMLGLQHFFDNAIGGSLHGESGEGLTPFGETVVRRAIEMGFIIDVAHSAPAVVDDVLAMGAAVVVSHTGMRGTCDSPRNIEDELMQRIAAQGGLIGIGYWDAVCDTTPLGVARSIKYARDLVGIGHVALGSDYDGSTQVTFDTSQLVVLTQALMDVGLSDAEIRLVMGENQLRFLLNHLP